MKRLSIAIVTVLVAVLVVISTWLVSNNTSLRSDIDTLEIQLTLKTERGRLFAEVLELGINPDKCKELGPMNPDAVNKIIHHMVRHGSDSVKDMKMLISVTEKFGNVVIGDILREALSEYKNLANE